MLFSHRALVRRYCLALVQQFPQRQPQSRDPFLDRIGRRGVGEVDAHRIFSVPPAAWQTSLYRGGVRFHIYYTLNLSALLMQLVLRTEPNDKPLQLLDVSPGLHQVDFVGAGHLDDFEITDE